MTETTTNARPEICADRPPDPGRRLLLSASATAFMAGGLAAGYGGFGLMAGRFLYPSDDKNKAWLFVTESARMNSGDSMTYQSPAGENISITRFGSSGDVGDFKALSSVCPHLGCQVHWEAQNNRFFCPCHNGVFDPSGKATGGPPGKAGQRLPEFPLKIENGLLFIEVRTGEAT